MGDEDDTRRDNSNVWQHVLSLCGRYRHRDGGKKPFSKQVHLFWYGVFTLAFLYVVFYFYFWLVVWNRYDDLNWKLYLRLNKWIPWYDIVFGLTCATFLYYSAFMCAFLSLVMAGHQTYIHPVHAVFSVFTLAGCVVVTVGVDKIWRSEWTTTLMSLKMTGPFLQIGAVVLMTSMSWFLISHWFTRPGSLWVIYLLIFAGVMLFLYTSPLYINSPCVTDRLPPRPKIFAHRGASEIFPENTLMAYRRSYEDGILGIESDVQISLDCVPFILHDRSLVRTTNVRDVFPHRVHNDAATFTMSELKSLNAGTWFLDFDPRGTVKDLTDSERAEASQQTIPTLEELSLLASNYTDRYFMFDLYYPGVNHPCYNRSVNVTIDAITRAGFPLDKLLWLEGTFHSSRPMGVTLVGEEYIPLNTLRKMNIGMTNVGYTELTDNNTREYLSHNISINVWVINSIWFYSMYWCMGISSTTSDRCHLLNSLQAPIWYLSPSGYLATWVTVDIVSAVIIIAIVFIQRNRYLNTSFGLVNKYGSAHNEGYSSGQEKTAL